MKYFTVQSCGMELRGLIHLGTSPTKPIVIIIHGYFSSNKIGPNRLYYLLAEALNKNGFTVVRCDLRGMGESEGEISNIHLLDHVQDVKNILTAVCEEYKRSVILVGHSCGCWSVLENLLNAPHVCDKAVLVAPPYSSDKTLSAFFNDSMILDLKTKGYTYRNELYTSYSFFDDALAFEKVCARLKNNQVPAIVLVGGNDQYVEQNDLKLFCERSNIGFKCIAGGDHNFLREQSRVELIDDIICYLAT